MPAPAIIFPADPLHPRRPDPHFAWEARTLRELGGEQYLVDHDALLAGEAEDAVRLVPRDCGPVWYRGWMIPSADYAAFARALADRGANLLTSAPAYTSAHELPGWYGVFEGATPPSVWIPLAPAAGRPGPEQLAAAVARLGGRGPAIVKDYVKSRKDEWDEACYIPELADPAAVGRVVERFVDLQGDFLAGGVVLRRFEEFARIDGTAVVGANGPEGGEPAGGTPAANGSSANGAPKGGVPKDAAPKTGSDGSGESTDPTGGNGRAVEARVWWLDGEPVLVGPHPDAPEQSAEPDLTEVRPLVRALGCRFVTTDLASRADGSGWRVVEVGDGQVSGLPRGIDVTGLLAALLAA
ncbi:ATP-grasp domain-containing protein [Kitasatospora sp. CM 4170]|uniref:ATP-grasp domain-containing protein n=1 Tax=Kitasatospora aburaviensis TaxID=67265 RepID=A0ABW1ERT3_9ACTN|nr:ATP-grasp domain-containing protein [Kitasatospora sp. CM 4170]WNM45873.1 ATP-grasp domain-containing protein [Kitasatospora sp. CM 4170]